MQRERADFTEDFREASVWTHTKPPRALLSSKRRARRQPDHIARPRFLRRGRREHNPIQQPNKLRSPTIQPHFLVQGTTAALSPSGPTRPPPLQNSSRSFSSPTSALPLHSNRVRDFLEGIWEVLSS